MGRVVHYFCIPPLVALFYFSGRKDKIILLIFSTLTEIDINILL